MTNRSPRSLEWEETSLQNIKVWITLRLAKVCKVQWVCSDERNSTPTCLFTITSWLPTGCFVVIFLYQSILSWKFAVKLPSCINYVTNCGGIVELQIYEVLSGFWMQAVHFCACRRPQICDSCQFITVNGQFDPIQMQTDDCSDSQVRAGEPYAERLMSCLNQVNCPSVGTSTPDQPHWPTSSY